jgi:hypothetical protein
VVFLSIIEYFYTRGESKYDSAAEAASKNLVFEFENIMFSLFNCKVKIHEKYGILWLLSGKSIIMEDESGEMTSFLEKRYKNVRVIREAKDLEDISEIEEDKAYIFIGEIRSEASYLIDIASNLAEKEKIKK